jgi:hypothetical protein
MGRILSRELTKSAYPKLDGAESSRFMVDPIAGFETISLVKFEEKASFWGVVKNEVGFQVSSEAVPGIR